MNIAIIGYGKMGKAVEEVAIEKGHRIIARIDAEEDWNKNLKNLKSSDVAIEFSTPATVTSNITRCFHMNIPIVTGTTGWDNQVEAFKEMCKKKDQALLKSSNFSIGVNVFFKINQHLASFMNMLDHFEVSIDETHHTGKLDKPSGTGLQLAEDILQRLDRKKNWVNRTTSNASEIPVISNRIADVSGIHHVVYQSDTDIIELKHTAKNRIGFARGAVLAAEWLAGRKGFFTMDDMLSDII